MPRKKKAAQKKPTRNHIQVVDNVARNLPSGPALFSGSRILIKEQNRAMELRAIPEKEMASVRQRYFKMINSMTCGFKTL